MEKRKTSGECEHGSSVPQNCTECIAKRYEANGVRDSQGVLHSDNGAGYCIGEVVNNKCVHQVRECPVLNTPEQLKTNRREDLTEKLSRARIRTAKAREEYRAAYDEFYDLTRQLEKEMNYV